MAEIKNKKIKKPNEKQNYSQDAIPQSNAGFRCSWSTFWAAIGVLAVILGSICSVCNWLANKKIKPVYREIQDCREKIQQTNILISANENKRDESIGYQIKILEQKIELSRVKK